VGDSRALAAAQTRAADDDRGDDVELQTHPGDRLHVLQETEVYDPRKRGK